MKQFSSSLVRSFDCLHRQIILLRAVTLLCFLGVVSDTLGEVASAFGQGHLSDPVPVTEPIKSFLREQCLDCHQGESAEAGFDLDELEQQVDGELAFAKWVRVHDRVADHEMPPPEEASLGQTEREHFLGALSNVLKRYEREQRSEDGRVHSRRLTNVQLERTLHDLLAIATPLANLMPEEPRVDGFTGLSQSQSMSHFLLESHLNVVDTALAAAIDRLLDPIDPFQRTYTARQLARSNPNQRCRDPEMIDDLAVVWSSGLVFYGRITSTVVRESGWYRIRFKASSVKQPESGGVWCSVRSGQCNSGAPLMDWITSFEATEEPVEHVVEAWLPAGHMIEIRPADATLRKASFRGGQVGAGEGGPQNVPGVALHSMHIEAIFPGGDQAKVQRQVFGDLKINVDSRSRSVTYAGDQPYEDTKAQVIRFARRAFRRSVQERDLDEYLMWLRRELDSGEDPVAALLATYRAILCSSRFLYLMEAPGSLDGEAIASRLSYFLWGSMPDDELLEAASQKDFLKPSHLVSQVDRMLEHPRGKDFIKDFASQWLDLMDIDFTEPDRKLFPDFDIVVQNSMLSETHQFLQWMLDQDAPVTDLLDSSQTFLNSRLADYYGIEGVEGDQMRLVSLSEESHRGGLLSHGSILKVTANGTNTSPVLRGVWVSERLLGVSVPPPPENVPAVEPDIRGAKTIREQLSLHLSHIDCRGCHAKTDPPGYALENFDAAGRWRDAYRVVQKGRSRGGPVIDAGGIFVDGREFDGFDEFRQQLAQKPLPLARNFAEKLLVYGTGSLLSFSDRDEIDRLIVAAEKNHYGIRAILDEVVTSSLFLMK